MQKPVVLIMGASDLGTACALRLTRAGMQVVLFEKDCPLDIYHSRSFSGAVFLGYKSIEKITARTFAQALEEDSFNSESNILDFIRFTILNREIPVVLEKEKYFLRQLSVDYIIVCDPGLIGNVKNDIPDNAESIGFGNNVDQDNYAYTICNADSYFGRVMYAFNEIAASNSTNPIHKKDTSERIKAPLEGVFQSSKAINDLIHEKEEIGKINDIPILSPALGRVSGILNSGVIVPAGAVFVEIDTSHSGQSGHILTKDSFCLAGAVLETIMYDIRLKENK